MRRRKFSLAFLQGEDLLLDAAGDDQLVDENRLVLTETMRAIGGLVLHRRVPPGIVVDDRIGSGQIESDAPARRLIRKIGTSPA
jgi:hypothetical protein